MSISETHKTWLYDVYEWRFSEDCFHSLLSLTSHSEEGGGEPRWLVFCDYLAKAMVNRSAEQGAGEIERQLHTWAMKLWGPDPLSREKLAWEWFGEQGQNEIIDRAFAVASLVGQHHDKSLPPLFPNAVTEQLLSAPERAALLAYLVERHGPRDQVRVPVMLVNDSAPPGEKGRRSQLRLTPIRVPADQHGELFRAPAALLLSLRQGDNTSFEDGLRKVERLLAGCLNPPGADEGWGLLWSLHPEPMALDHQDAQKPYDWFMHSITGASATGAFALAGLWVLREQLDETLEGMTLARQQLRDIHPAQFAISAQLEGDAPPDPRQPLGWRWNLVHGLDEKLGSFVRDKQLMSGNESPVSLALVSHDQGYRGDLIRPEPVKNIAEAIDRACREIGGLLPATAEALRRYLLDVRFEQSFDVEGRPIDEAQPRTPLAPSNLIAPLRSEALRSDPRAFDGPVHAKDIGRPNAIAWYLLWCYSRWAGGDHILWGEPARLGEDFNPIRLKAQTDVESSIAKQEARSLIELLDPVFMPKQPSLWVLSAPPAFGKTTIMAEYQMYQAFRALRQYARGGHFGVVPIWIPSRELDAGVLGKGTLGQAINDWLARRWPALGSLQSLLSSPYARVQILLDGVNELRCDADRRTELLTDWLAADFGPAHTHLPPLITVRSLELIRPDGAMVAELKPWDLEQSVTYMVQRLGHRRDCVDAMVPLMQADLDAAGDNPDKRLYSSPGLLSLACDLMEKGLLPPSKEQGLMSRARLLSTLIWSRLRGEDHGHKRNVPTSMLGDEEKDRLVDLSTRLKEGDWHLPQKPGVLLSALARQARYMQFEVPQIAMELPEVEWWADVNDDEKRKTLTKAAGHLDVVLKRREMGSNGRACNWLGFRHQLMLEFLAVYGLSSDGPLPSGIAAPSMLSDEEEYESWLERKQARNELENFSDSKKSESSFDWYHPPHALVSKHEESIKVAAQWQLRGDPGGWVRRMIREGNVPLAARIALECWSAFGEPQYPQEDPQGPWRPERRKGGDGTHEILNELRAELHKRMFCEDINVAQRIESGDLLGQIGGSPLLEICGEALILKDENWMPIGDVGGKVGFLMGDLTGDDNERTESGELYQVDGLPSFRMAGYLVVNAQYRCFQQSDDFEDRQWWSDERAWEWLQDNTKGDRREYYLEPDSFRKYEAYDIQSSYGLSPVTCNYWQAKAYVRWEQSQRKLAGQPTDVFLPTEAQWEAAARWPKNQLNPDGIQWKFAHTSGSFDVGKKGRHGNSMFSDVKPWHFNHNQIFGSRTSPVGVFVDGKVRLEGRVLADFAGNAKEWCSSRYPDLHWDRWLGPGVEVPDAGWWAVVRSDGPISQAEDNRVSRRRKGEIGNSLKDGVGFRLVRLS